MSCHVRSEENLSNSLYDSILKLNKLLTRIEARGNRNSGEYCISFMRNLKFLREKLLSFDIGDSFVKKLASVQGWVLIKQILV